MPQCATPAMQNNNRNCLENCAAFPTGHGDATIENGDQIWFRAKLPQFWDFLGVFSWSPKSLTSKWIFRAPHPLIFITSHKMPFLPRNLHVSTWRSPDNAIRKEKIRNTIRPKCCACHAKCCVCKCNSFAEDDANELRLSHKSTLRHVIKQNCSTQT